jgi:hypothetical protein
MMDAVSSELFTPPQHDYCNKGQGYDRPTTYKGFPLRGQIHFRHSGGFNAVFCRRACPMARRTTYNMWARDPATASREQRGKPCWKFW